MTTAALGVQARLRERVLTDEDIEALITKALCVAQYCWEKNKVDHYENYSNLATALHQSHAECLSLRQRI